MAINEFLAAFSDIASLASEKPDAAYIRLQFFLADLGIMGC
jgi:hypothetical protein